MQRSRPRLTTCPWGGCLPRFWYQSTATADHRMAAHKSLETMLGMDYNPLQSKFAVRMVANENWCQKAVQRLAIAGRALTFGLKIFRAICLCKCRIIVDPLMYWPTSNNLLSKICPEFQVFSSHISELGDLLDENRAKNVRTQNISIPIYGECYNMCWSRFCFQEFLCILSDLDIRLCSRRISSSWRVLTIHIPFFKGTICSHGLVVNTSFSDFGDMGSNPAQCWNSRPPVRPFCVALTLSVDWHASFLYCRALYTFFLLKTRQWRSRADRFVNLNTNIRLPLFWRTWTRARARTRPHVRACHMSRD